MRRRILMTGTFWATNTTQLFTKKITFFLNFKPAWCHAQYDVTLMLSRAPTTLKAASTIFNSLSSARPCTHARLHVDDGHLREDHGEELQQAPVHPAHVGKRPLHGERPLLLRLCRREAQVDDAEGDARCGVAKLQRRSHVRRARRLRVSVAGLCALVGGRQKLACVT